MEIKILQVFYGKDGLPYKDKERQVHFPITGTGFLGASNTTKIKFYYDELDNLDETTWVAVSKLPNGKVGSRVLESHTDSELNEHYALLELDSYYTQYKGDVFISLQGYQGGVDFDYDEENSQYEIHGTPTIAATGSIKFTINYANQFVGSGETDNINFQRILAALGTKLGMRAYSEHVEELPSEGSPDVFYVVNDDPNNPNLANIYIWNENTRHYIWVGDNTLDLGNYYTKNEGETFENQVDTKVKNIQNQLSSVASGSPKGVYATLSDLETAYPTGTSGIYVVSANGHWYYWNGSAWADGGLYLSTQNYTDIEDTLDKVLIESISSSLGTGTIEMPLKVKAGQTIRVKVTGPGINIWLRETSGGADLEELGYVGANGTHDFVASYDGNYLRIYCEGASTIKCDILETYIPTLFDKVNSLESDVDDLQEDVADFNEIEPEISKIKQQYSFNSGGVKLFDDFNDAPLNTIVFLAGGVSNYTHAPTPPFDLDNGTFVKTYKIGTQNRAQYVWLSKYNGGGNGCMAMRSAYTDNGNLVWSNWQYVNLAKYGDEISQAIKLHNTYSFNNGVKVFTDFNDAPDNERVYLSGGITNYDNAPDYLFGTDNNSYVETYTISSTNKVQYVWLSRNDGSGVLCSRAMYYDNGYVWTNWTYNDYGNEPIVVSTATDLYNMIIWLNNNNKKNATVILTPNTTFDFSNGINGEYNDIPLGNNITIKGSPNSLIYCNYQGDNTDVNQLYSIFKKWTNAGGFTLYGVVIRAYNIRYCVHDEDGTNPDSYHNKYINCDFYLNQNGKTDDERSYYVQCIGGGLGRNANILITGCKFETVFDDFVPDVSHPDLPEVTYHNSNGGALENYKSFIVIRDNYFKHSCAVACYGSQTEKTVAIICNNNVSVKPYKYWQTGGASDNFELLEWNNKLHNQAEFTEIDYTPTFNPSYAAITNNYSYKVDKTLFLIVAITAATDIGAWTEIGSMQRAYQNADFYFKGVDNSNNEYYFYLAPAGSIYSVTPIPSNRLIKIREFFRIG